MPAEHAADIVATPSATTQAYRDAVTQGVKLAREKRYALAADAFAQACAFAPQSASAWRALGDMRFAMGDWAGSNEAHLKSAEAPADPRISEARAAVDATRFDQAYALLSERLAATPTDITALSLMVEVALRTGSAADTLGLLDRVLERAPGFEAAWPQLARVLQHMPPTDAFDAVRRRRAERPDIWGYRPLEAWMLERSGDYEAANSALVAMLAERPDEPALTVLLGHIQRTLGNTEQAIATYRKAIAIRPDAAEPWWAMSDIKTFRFSDADLAQVATLAEESESPTERIFANFALGRVHELAGDYDQSFCRYALGNELKRAAGSFDRATIDRDRAKAADLFTPDFFAAREGWGCQAQDPIFIVGMPRSGSTLVEQILASHPAVEATRELSDLPSIVHSLGLAASSGTRGYPAMLEALSAAEVAALGQDYLDRTRCQRRTERPHFIDKLPANFAHVGLIRLILPNAHIIDVRRDIRACGLSIFKQYFATGFSFAFNLDDIAAHYAGYLAAMAHWDRVLPGYVHHIPYEHLVADFEIEVRQLLDYLDLPFERACLEFFDTQRPIRTPSSEQVRRPINDAGLNSWRPYAQWLGPLHSCAEQSRG